jgi:hypothetical protein
MLSVYEKFIGRLLSVLFGFSRRHLGQGKQKKNFFLGGI